MQEVRQETTRIVQQNPVQSQGSYQKKKFIFRTYQIIWYFLGVIEVLLGFRVVLKMHGASPVSLFVNFVYGLSEPFARPFAGIFGVTVPTTRSVVEWSTFVAMVVYALIAYGLVELIQLVKPTNPEEVEEGVSDK
mgnify:CR=1 FL=1